MHAAAMAGAPHRALRPRRVAERFEHTARHSHLRRREVCCRRAIGDVAGSPLRCAGDPPSLDQEVPLAETSTVTESPSLKLEPSPFAHTCNLASECLNTVNPAD